MIVYDLMCQDGGHRFEGWFGSSRDFDDQQARGLVVCPHCGGGHVIKAVMAPRLTRKGNQLSPDRPPAVDVSATVHTPPPFPPEAQAALLALAKAQADSLKTSRWVGDSFADNARAMHYGDKPVEPIHGQATREQARDLIEEGVDIAPVLFPISSPDQVN